MTRPHTLNKMTQPILTNDTPLNLPLLEWDDLLRILSGVKPKQRHVTSRNITSDGARRAQFALRLSVATFEGRDGDPLRIPKGAVIYIDPADTDPSPGKPMIVQVDPYTLLVGVVLISDQGKPRLSLPNTSYPEIDLSTCEPVYRGTIVSWEAQ